MHHVLNQPQKTINGETVADSVANWLDMSTVPGALLGHDAALIFPQLDKVGIQIRDCDKLCEILQLWATVQSRRTTVKSRRSKWYFFQFLREDTRLGGILFYYNKEERKFELLTSDMSFDSKTEDTTVIIALRKTNNMKPTTSEDELKGRVADPEHCKAIQAREVR